MHAPHTSHRPRRRGDLHHVFPPERLRLSAPREVLRREHAPIHPPRVRGLAALVLALVFFTSAGFWAAVWWDDATRNVFFPRRTLSPAILCGLFAWGAWTQLVMPLRLLRALATTSRITISRALRLVLSWAATGVVTMLWWIFSDDVTGWFALFGGALLAAAAVLQRCVVAAFKVDLR